MSTLKSLAVLTLTGVIASTSLLADNRNHRDHRGGYERTSYYGPARHVKVSHHSSGNWVVPLVVGSVLGYALSEPRRESVTYVTTPPAPARVVYTPQPTYQEQWVYFSDCDCQRKVLVPVR